ncbi:MAG: Omp28-related outer membrane protein [Ignavibacteriae bacterium]|nr:Omp28-related outer membrane protein [Ignavibacteriota bacterium]
MKKILTLLFLLSFLLPNNKSYSFYIWQDFDNPNHPPLGWTLNTTNVFNWDWTVMCSGYGQGFGSIKGNCSDASAGLTFDIISPQFTAAGAGDSLIFDHAYATYGSANDQLKIWYSTDGGNNWTQLVLLNGGTSGELVTAPATGQAFVPTTSQWATKRYSLPAGTNKIKFTAISAYGNNMYLDNIKIGTRYGIDGGAVGFRRYVKAIMPNSPDTPKVYVRNYGTTTQSIPVTLTITPGGYTQTMTAASVAPGFTMLLTFPVYTAPSSGNITMKAYSTLSGDQNILNDTVYNFYVASNNGRNVLLEYCTGTWCQWCPCGKTRANDLLSIYPNSIVLAYHGSGTDPWINFNGNNIISLLGMTAYPLGTVDRGIDVWSCGYSNFVERPIMRYLNSPVAPVKIDVVSKNYNTGTRTLNVTLNNTALTNLTGQYKINYVITEDNLVYTQAGNSYCTGGSNYVHKWVVRNMVNTATGENLNTGGTWTNGQVISKTFSTVLDAGWVDANCKLTVFVYKDGSPLNSNAEIQQSIQTNVMMTGINDPLLTPVKFELSQNYPNPFNPSTNVKFSVPKYGHYTFRIFDITGKLVDTYLDSYISAGIYNADIDGTKLSSGVYFYTLQGEGFNDTKKMILIK